MTKKTGRKQTKSGAHLKAVLPTRRNRQLQAQTRKILGKHYAAKYRVK